MKHITAAAISALVVLTVASAASASEPRHVRRHAQPVTTSTGDPRNAFDYYPGWGRDSVPLYGVPPGLIYGGATSAPAGR